NSQTYFNEQIRGNTELFNKLKIAYGKDAENFKTLAEAKDATDKLLVRIIGNRWSDLYGSQEEALQAIIDMAPRAAKMAMNEQERNRIYADAAEAR
ncbi:hypothetical protein JYB64_26240, partial [Algoriphagus aestuarii]|nr:hypothetical protein [Algoriphagus aestuarii]